jgi:hypothetical protein
METDFYRKNPGTAFTKEFYCDQFIQAEFPQDPSAHPGIAHNPQSAAVNRWYREFISTTMYHTCKVGRCKATEREPCSKHFPVIYVITWFYLNLINIEAVLF